MNLTFRPVLAAAAALMLLAPSMSNAQSNAASPTSVATPAAFPTIAGLQIMRAEFGIFSGLGSAAAFLNPVRVVMRDEQPIGWVLALQTQKTDVRWREVFSMPAPPKRWGLEPNSTDVRPTVISADRRTVTTERRTAPVAGTIHRWWKLEASDPAGLYTIRIYVEDVLAATFEFEVQ